MEKRNQGELLVQKVRKLHENLLKEVKIQSFCTHIRFGSIVQLIAADLRCERPDGKWVLSFSIDEKTLQKYQHLNEKFYLCVSFAKSSCVRNSFKIITPDTAKDKCGELLKYNEDFMLQCIDCEDSPLVLYSSPKSAGLINGNSDTAAAYFNQISEISQSVGIYQLPQNVNGTNHSGDAEKCIPIAHCRWRAVHQEPTIRYETDGDPVPSNTRLIIQNSFTNRNLATEFVWTKSFFGMELGLSCNNYFNQHRRELRQNVWMLGTDPE